MDEIYHYPPELFNLLVDTIPLLFRSKKDVLLFFKGSGVSKKYTEDVESRIYFDRQSITKYEIVRNVLSRLNEAGEKALRERREILKRVVEFESFSSCWPDDQLKAKGLVAEIQKVINTKDAFTRMKIAREKEAEKNRKEYQQRIEEAQSLRLERSIIKEDFNQLFSMSNPHKRGKALEIVLNNLFKSYGVLIRESFSLIGSNGEGIIEQIDGVIELDNKIFLVEMKWWDKPVGVGEVSHHLVRIFNRGHACGIFISTSPFTQPAVAVCKESLSKALIVLVNLEEIYKVLDQEENLKDYLKRKIQAAIINKEPLHYPV
ncbi:restriction endonuclease [Bacillus sp. ISL-37]|uniref:restriction endonuclease n=1 Tax=Bacillus sp. ISL-37 TaxID=2819123 RepID=UPI001BE8A7AB|nr:restriction endonuclease [Bacillus sp. ISL-37]MBT2683366.1 restriction endonuclease [Bacillus sp. ISL-37]